MYKNSTRISHLQISSTILDEPITFHCALLYYFTLSNAIEMRNEFAYVQGRIPVEVNSNIRYIVVQINLALD